MVRFACSGAASWFDLRPPLPLGLPRQGSSRTSGTSSIGFRFVLQASSRQGSPERDEVKGAPPGGEKTEESGGGAP